ncbi:hypothetical protein ACLOJK_009048 [Asimina triloba]
MAIGTHRLPPLWSSLPQLLPSHCRPPLWSRRPQLPPSLSLHPPPETHQSPSLLLSLCHSICVEMCCLDADYDYYVKLLRLFYLADDLILDSLESICIEYLEAVPWEDKEEEAILKAVSGLGPSAMSILARIQPVNSTVVKNVFISAFFFATSIDNSLPPFTNELKTSAQEQVEYMLMEDEDLPLITTDDDVKAVVEIGLAKLFSVFEFELNSLLDKFDHTFDVTESEVLQSLSDLEWMCNVLPKMDMKGFVCSWKNVSVNVLSIVQDKKLSSGIWAVKVRLIEVTTKVLEAVGYGNVILSAPSRVRYPDLSEAFEVWCYRTKAANRRLQVGFNEVGNTTVSL